MKTLSRFWNWATGRWRREASPRNLFALLSYTWVGQAVATAVELKIPDHLDSGSKSVEELAELTGTRQPLLEQMLRTLAGFGILASDANGQYRNTATSTPLVSNRSSWIRAYVLFWKHHLYPSGDAMLEMVRTGRTAFEIAHGMPAYELYGRDKEQGRIFTEFMSSVTDWQNPAILEFFDFRPYRHVVDVGGGRASFISSILQANPHLSGTIFDEPYMEEPATERLGQAGLLDRCSFVGGNFFEAVPAGADLYVIKHVLTDWSNRDAIRILTNIATAMSPGSTLVLIEGLMDERNGRDQILKMRDLEEMIFAGGRERTRNEFQTILQSAGLQWDRAAPTAVVDCSLIYAHKQLKQTNGKAADHDFLNSEIIVSEQVGQ